jgi:hypothetical protein
MASFFIAVPHYGQIVAPALEGLMLATQKNRYTIKGQGGSFLTLGFNRLLHDYCLSTRAEHGWDRFAMHHADVSAAPGWLDWLETERARVDADILSCVIPLKGPRGVTSTGFMAADGRIRRLTMHELMQMPVTFDGAWGRDGETLLVNTGLWIMRLDRPWVEDICFQVRNGVRVLADGSRRASALSEDWDFSLWAAARGLRVWATRGVQVTHWDGSQGFANDHAWGTHHTDEGDKEKNPCSPICQP